MATKMAAHPNRYVFDEGHHVFDAADSAFSAYLSGRETAELRHWVRGAEDGRRGRARGLKRRIEDLVAGDDAALANIEEALEAARALPRKAGKTGYRRLNHLVLAKYFSCIFGPHFTYESATQTAYMICNVNYIPPQMRCWRLHENLPTH